MRAVQIALGIVLVVAGWLWIVLLGLVELISLGLGDARSGDVDLAIAAGLGLVVVAAGSLLAYSAVRRAQMVIGLVLAVAGWLWIVLVGLLFASLSGDAEDLLAVGVITAPGLVVAVVGSLLAYNAARRESKAAATLPK